MSKSSIFCCDKNKEIIINTGKEKKQNVPASTEYDNGAANFVRLLLCTNDCYLSGGRIMQNKSIPNVTESQL